MAWFGPSKDELWKQLSQEIGADFVAGQLWKGSKVQAHVGPWTITLDTHTVSSGESQVTYTRMRRRTSAEPGSGLPSIGRESSASWAS